MAKMVTAGPKYLFDMRVWWFSLCYSGSYGHLLLVSYNFTTWDWRQYLKLHVGAELWKKRFSNDGQWNGQECFHGNPESVSTVDRAQWSKQVDHQGHGRKSLSLFYPRNKDSDCLLYLLISGAWALHTIGSMGTKLSTQTELEGQVSKFFPFSPQFGRLPAPTYKLTLLYHTTATSWEGEDEHVPSPKHMTRTHSWAFTGVLCQAVYIVRYII